LLSSIGVIPKIGYCLRIGRFGVRVPMGALHRSRKELPIFTRTIKKNNLPLNRYCSNTYSQNGEDGILSEILNRLGTTIPQFGSLVEFGAWDGKYLSNTFALVLKGWRAVYIEADKNRFYDLLKTSQKYPNITAINRVVEYKSSSSDSLDRILKTTDLQQNFEVLSIDIDSYDLAVWESLQSFKPKIVIIEINSSYRPGLKRRHGQFAAQGNSFTSTLEVALKKGYMLAAHTGNLIFIQAELFPMLKIPKHFIKNPNLLFIDYFLSQKDRILHLMNLRQKIVTGKIINFIEELL
jgi:hypothetical protein